MVEVDEPSAFNAWRNRSSKTLYAPDALAIYMIAISRAATLMKPGITKSEMPLRTRRFVQYPLGSHGDADRS